VIYDVSKYQNALIVEDDDKKPPTFYGQLKLVGEHIVIGSGVQYNILRPLFAYGGVGDMNSLIAKTLYACLTGRQTLDMFLDPDKIKDYIYVDDFCRAIVAACDQGLWGEDFNVAEETPVPVSEIVQLTEDVLFLKGMLTSSKGLILPSDLLKWHPSTDYLGNHRMSSKKFRDASGWIPEVPMYEGLARVLTSIQKSLASNEYYDPLLYLSQASRKGVDLSKFFPA
jgi:nucleoside-diphosphate-sugar epimerase